MNEIIKKQSAILPLTGSKSYDSALQKINADAVITPEGLRDYFQSLRDKGLKISTINHKIAAVKKALKIMAERMGADSWQARYELARIFEQNELKRVKVEQFINPGDCLTKKEILEIIETAILSENLKTSFLIMALYVTAVRITELCQMRYIDCETKKNGIVIQIIGKGRKLRTVFMSK